MYVRYVSALFLALMLACSTTTKTPKERFAKDFKEAHLYIQDGFYKDAATIYRKILKAEPSNTIARKKLALCLSKMGFTHGARVQLSIAEKQSPDPTHQTSRISAF